MEPKSLSHKMATSSLRSWTSLLARSLTSVQQTRSLAVGNSYANSNSKFFTFSVDQIPREALKTDGPGARVSVNGQVCSKPQEAKTNLLNFLTQSDLQKRTGHLDIPYFVPGSILAVTRADPYSKSGESRVVGICIARHNKGVGSNFILRNVVNGVAVEVRFELYSPVIKKIEVLKLERRRRAKLYYLRKKSPRENTFSETMKPTLSNKLLVHKRRRK